MRSACANCYIRGRAGPRGRSDPSAHVVRRLVNISRTQFLVRRSRHLELDVNPVEQRSADLPETALDDCRCAATMQPFISWYRRALLQVIGIRAKVGSNFFLRRPHFWESGGLVRVTASASQYLPPQTKLRYK